MAFALFRNKRIGFAKETVPGTPEAAGEEEYGLECTQIDVAAEAEAIDKAVFRGSISAAPGRIGKVSATASLAGELKNSGTLGVVPKIDSVLLAARFRRIEIFKMLLEDVAGADAVVPFKTKITGADSGHSATAVALEGNALYAFANANFQASETIESEDEAFSAKLKGTEAGGYLYKPSSSAGDENTFTLRVSDGGLEKIIYGAAATFALELSAQGYPGWTATFTGIAKKDGWGAPAPDIGGIETESHQPKVVVSARIAVGGLSAPVASSISLDLGNTVTLIEDLNSDTWLKYAIVTARAATGSIAIAADIEKSAALYQKLFAGETASLSFKIGEGAGNRIDIVCPAAQYAGISESDSNSLLAQTIALKPTGEDDEIIMWFR